MNKSTDISASQGTLNNKEDKTSLKPFIKWAGGKTQILPVIKKMYPHGLGKQILKYAEPFVGGGAVLFDILSSYDLKEVYISDNNKELINAYTVIRDNVDKLIATLTKFKDEYSALDDEGREKYYYKKREAFNGLLQCDSHEIEKAALFIFLNKTCFNGLYRVNRQGYFNVPSGKYKNPGICDEDNLRNISRALKNVTIQYGDYQKSDEFIDEATFVYFDPPYRPISQTSAFTAYTKDVFDDDAQIRLADYVKKLSKKGAKIALSNSDPKNENKDDDFFDNLYSDFNIERISAVRAINSNGKGRGKISELFINNYVGEGKMRNFDEWLSRFKTSIAGYDYYTDFEKVFRNAEEMKIELNILNSLIGSSDIERDFENIISRYPEVLKCIPLLLAVRGYEIYAKDDNGEFLYRFDEMNCSASQYKEFMRKTGLFSLISEHLVNNLYDYILGVEVGLDSNGRKNRGGHLMENLVEGYIRRAGFVHNESYFKEMYLSEIEKRWDIDLSSLSNNGKAKKRFDFVVKTPNSIYAVETNFYRGNKGGSKLNETARSYKMLATESKNINGFKFVWITDGTAWNRAKGNLKETFDFMDMLYSIDDMENGIIDEVFI